MMHNRRRSVLIAENDRANAQRLKLELERVGFRVYVAFDGEQAAILAARQRFELIIANLDSPEINGTELYRHVREDLNLTEIPIAACTSADSGHEIAQLAFNDQSVRVFDNPVEPAAVLEFAQETVAYLVAAV